MAVTLPPSHGVNVLFVRGELYHCRVGHALEGGGALEPQVVGVHLGSVIAQSLIVLQVVQVARCRVGWGHLLNYLAQDTTPLSPRLLLPSNLCSRHPQSGHRLLATYATYSWTVY